MCELAAAVVVMGRLEMVALAAGWMRVAELVVRVVIVVGFVIAGVVLIEGRGSDALRACLLDSLCNSSASLMVARPSGTS